MVSAVAGAASGTAVPAGSVPGHPASLPHPPSHREGAAGQGPGFVLHVVRSSLVFWGLDFEGLHASAFQTAACGFNTGCYKCVGCRLYVNGSLWLQAFVTVALL